MVKAFTINNIMRDKKIWIFNSGTSFDGNPKWLFYYIINNRKDIMPYWFCYNTESMQYIRNLGFKAYLFDSKEAQDIGQRAGVYVVNQRKEVFQDFLEGITILNLWHGVGCKTVELKVTTGFLNERITKKYIQNMSYYKNNELFLVTSPLMEKHFIEQCGLNEKNIVRAGYPCNASITQVETFNHDILKSRGGNRDTKIAIYSPTYRDASATNFFAKAISDMDKLIEVLKENNFVLIFKMHPKMMNDYQYKNLKNLYENCPQLIFWDNCNDVYEIFDEIELAIVDYSSIFYDMLAKGVKHFVRYIFDYDKGEMRDFALDYEEMTCGSVCRNFQELLNIFTEYQKEDISTEIERIKSLFWEYDDDTSCDRIVNAALQYEVPEDNVLPTLYSFDIFDTLIGRSTFQPIGVFLYVQDKMIESDIDFPRYLQQNFFKIRPWAEKNVREYYKKSKLHRKSEVEEITYDLIYDYMQKTYDLSDLQIEQLKKWELEAEYDASIPYEENINKLKELVEAGEDVVLISDMYLPKDFISMLLGKADPMLTELPLFVSSEYGKMKTNKELYYEVYHAMNYHYGKWIHYGDNPKADGNVPKSLGIEVINHKVPSFNGYENKMIEFSRTYDMYQVSNLFRKFRQDEHTSAEKYAYCYVALYFVPYISWVLRHALEHDIRCLYFISRDGYHLKRIADAIIEEKQYEIKTKYIYGSRKAWRIPSQIDSIDEEFWSEFGNFVDIKDYNELLEAAELSSVEFQRMFPELEYLKDKETIQKNELVMIREVLRESEEYCTHLLKRAGERRKIVQQYLQQEIDTTEKYAFAEYWGRGYTQTCLAKILSDMQNEEVENIFYYARSIYPTHGKLIRYNFSMNNWSYIFIETIFANLPYKSIKNYEMVNEVVSPVIISCENNELVHQALETWLPAFAKDFAALKLENEKAIEYTLFDFGLSYFHRNGKDSIFADNFASLKDSVSIYGETTEWAPEITWKAIAQFIGGKRFVTKNMTLSVQRSAPIFKKMYKFYQKTLKKKMKNRKLK